MTAPPGPPGAVRPAAIRAAEAVVELRRRVAIQHAAGADPLATWTLATDLFDQAITTLWESIVADLPAAAAVAARRMSLVAVGGYGRREMAPASDVDLMLLHDGRDPAVVAELAARVVQDLFDAGLQVGQSVRTIGEACRLAGTDATILTCLLESRCVTGPAAPVERLAARLRWMVRWAPRRVAEKLIASRREEADRFGETVSLLEPNVKRSPGGLRDIQLVHWLGVVLHGAESLDEIAAVGGLGRGDLLTLREAATFLARVRTDLHLTAGRCQDELTRDHQARFAAERGIESSAGLLGVERFMREYIGHTRGVKRIVDAQVAAIRGGAGGGLAARLLGHAVEGCYRVGPTTVAALPGHERQIATDPTAILRLLELALLHGLPVDATTWEVIRAEDSRPKALDPPPDSAACAAFLRLFLPPPGAVAAWRSGLPDLLRRLHDLGVLEWFVPGFAHARDLLQFNNYHKYTVDEHCILAVERCLSLAGDPGWPGRAWQGLARPRPLLLAVLFHDLGKGYAGDHSEVGAAMARVACGRLGVPGEEAEIVEFLVRQHLLMAHLAFHRNLGDDSIIAGFAREVGSPEVLRMLALLTAADVAAVGPGTWTTWKSDLLGQLSDRTRDLLAGEAPMGPPTVLADVEQLLQERPAEDAVRVLARLLPPAAVRGVPPARIAEELSRLARLPADGVFAIARWQPETSTVAITVGTHERVAAGVFHRVTAALAAERLEVLAADIHTFPAGEVLDRFTVRDPDFAGEPPAERLTDISAAIRSAVRAVEPPRIRPQWNPFAPQVQPAGRGPVRVRFDNQSSRQATIIEVFAHDSPGLLSQVARVLHESGLSVRAARIGTYLDQVVDAFHVTDVSGSKVDADDLQVTVRQRIEQAIAAVSGPVSGPS